MSSMFENYEKPTKGNRYLKEIDKEKGVVVRLLQNPVFAWKDIAFEPAIGDQKAKKVVEEYFPYTDPKKRPKITKRLDLLDTLSGKERYVKHVWACMIFNQELKEVQYWEINVQAIMDGLIAADKNGYNLLETDLKITKTETMSNGKKSYTYAVVPMPPQQIQKLPDNVNQLIDDLNIDLARIFTSGNPFEVGSDEEEFVNEDGTPFIKNEPVDTTELPDPVEIAKELPAVDLDNIQTPF